MRYTLNYLSELLAVGDEEAMKDYLSRMTAEISHRNTVNYCQNTTVNGLLQYYVGMARNQDISCDVNANCGDVTIAPVDLTVMLGNMMENAIRACGQMKEKRWITVKIGVLGGSMMIQIENPCENVQSSGKYPLDNSFLPAAAFKISREGGGLGLHSLEHTAEKYDGDARFRFDGQTKTFTSRVRLNLYPEQT
ncbi:MAG: ATP-binding protein [Clostridiales bacterium]|nr:ATP-binding protein [Clostridiales bacterium]